MNMYIKTNKPALLIYVILTLIPLSLYANNKNNTLAMVEVFTNTSYPVEHLEKTGNILKQNNAQLKIYNLDIPSQLEAEISKSLPDDPELAKKVILQDINSQTNRLYLEFRTAYEGAAKARSYSLTHYPAIVFNEGEAVVYGVQDIKEALNTYYKWKNR